MLFIKKKAKDAEIIAAKAAEEAKAAEGIQEAPKVELVKCPKCGREVEKERVKNAKYICYECGSYFRVKTKNRIRMVTDPKSFEPWFEDMPSSNPLGTEGYEDKVAAAQAKTNLKEAVTIGKATINGEPAVVGVCDARFLMSSMGYVVGEKIARAVEKATKEKLPVFMFCCSGGARMQEGIISLMQMAKTSAAFKKHSDVCIYSYRSYNRWCYSQLCNAWRYYPWRARCARRICRTTSYQADYWSGASRGLPEIRVPC